MLRHSINVFKKPHMAQLVDLIMPYRLHLQLFPDIHQVILGCGDCCDAGTWKTDFGCGAEFINHIGITGAFTLRKDFHQIVLVDIVKMVYSIRIIPIDAEIFCRRLEPCKTAHRLI